MLSATSAKLGKIKIFRQGINIMAMQCISPDKRLKIARMTAEGVCGTEIARQLDLHHNTVYNYLRKPEIKRQIAHISGEIARRVSRKAAIHAEEGVQFFIDTLNNTELPLEQRFRAAENLLKEKENSLKASKDYLIDLIEEQLDPDADSYQNEESSEKSEEAKPGKKPTPNTQ